MSGAIYSTGRTDYTTPEWIVNAVRGFFRDCYKIQPVTSWSPTNDIDLDPCSNSKSIVNARFNIVLFPEEEIAPNFQQGDGLAIGWQGMRTYVNPPFGKKAGEPGIAAWIDRAVKTFTLSFSSVVYFGTEIIMCIPDTPDTKSWKNGVLLHARGRCQLSRRVKFGGMVTGIPKPISLIYFGSFPELFKEHFKIHGRVENPSEVYKDQANITL